MDNCKLTQMLEKEDETYHQFDRLYKRCKRSLDEFYKTFQSNACGSTLSLAQLQQMTKEIQGLSKRVIELEDKIECVSKSLKRCDKSQPKTKCVAYSDRKLLPSEKKLLQPTEASCTDLQLGVRLRSRESPLRKRDKSCRLLGGEPPENQRKKVKRNRSQRTKEAMRSREMSGKKTGQSSKKDSQMELYAKVNKFIPRVLSELEVFHQSFIQACDSKERQIDEKTARDVLQVMGDQLKVLEGMESRLRG